MEGFPDSPESVALMLFAMLFEKEQAARNEAVSAWALDLFAECVAAVRGHRNSAEDRRRRH